MRAGSDRRERREIHPSGGAGDRVERSGRSKSRLDAGRVGDVDTDVARLRSGGHDVVTGAEFGGDGAAEHARGADEEDAETVGHNCRNPCRSAAERR